MTQPQELLLIVGSVVAGWIALCGLACVIRIADRARSKLNQEIDWENVWNATSRHSLPDHADWRRK